MNIIPQMKLFDESEFEELGDLERLQQVLGTLNDTALIRRLYRIRGKGRNDWPCEAMWNSFIASFLFEHETVESLLRELRRNRQLRLLSYIYSKLTYRCDIPFHITLNRSPLAGGHLPGMPPRR